MSAVLSPRRSACRSVAPFAGFCAGLVCCLSAAAQGDATVDCLDTVFCVPSVPGMPRTKAFQFSYENVLSYGLTADSFDPVRFPNSAGEARREERFEARLKFPLYLSKSFKLAMGISYFNEDYLLEDADEAANPLLHGLNDRNLKSMGAVLYMVRSWRGRHYFLMRLSAHLNGDYRNGVLPRDSYLKVSAAPMFGVKPNANTIWGVGMAWGYNFGKPSVYPFAVYNRTFNRRWGIEALLPARVAARVNFGESTLLYGGMALEGASYTVHLLEEEFGTLQLRKSEIRSFLRIEREIHDWLWCDFELGGRFSYRFELTGNEPYRPNTIVDMKRDPAAYARLGVFVVPPRKFLD